MNPTEQHTLASLVFAYALFEFLIRRVMVTSVRMPKAAAGRAAVLAVTLFLTLGTCTAGILSNRLAAGYALLALFTFLYELLNTARSWEESRHALEWFIGKQLVTAALLVTVSLYVTPVNQHEWYIQLMRSAFGLAGHPGEDLQHQWTTILSVASAYLFVLDGGTRIVRGVFNKFPKLYQEVVRKLAHNSQTEREENVGEWIGVLERLITLTFALTGSFTAMAFALTAKSIARFKELEDKEFAEYYLLGTSASMIVALGAGMLIKVMFGI